MIESKKNRQGAGSEESNVDGDGNRYDMAHNDVYNQYEEVVLR